MEKNCNTCKFAILSRNVTPCLNCDVDFCNWGSTDSVVSQGENLVALDCQVCGKEYMGEEPKGCCSGRDCACMGQPIEPMVCSSECWDRLMSRNRPQGEKRVSEGMQELKIYQYQAKRIEDAFRIVSNHFHSQHKKTCLDRDITWCWQTIKNILEGKINERVERF